MSFEILSLIHEIGQWVIRLVMIPVLARDHRPSVAMAWLALFAFTPWMALPAYLLLGKPVVRRRSQGHTRARKELIGKGYLNTESSTQAGNGLARLVERLTADHHGGIPAAKGNSAELLAGTESIVAELIRDIERAQHHVHLLFFLFNDDSTGRRVAEALAAAASRGVACRLLLDAFGCRVVARPSPFRSLAPWLQERGVHVEEVLAVRLIRRPLARFDLRNHRKIAVVDGRVAYTGSFNVHDADFGLEKGCWQEMMARLEGPVVRQLQLLFLEDWSFATGKLEADPGLFPSAVRAGEILAQAVPGGPEHAEDPIHHVLVAAIHSARERLFLTTPYFIPDEPMQMALLTAVLRGVRLDLVLPEKSDQRAADAAARGYLDELLRHGANVHLFTAGLLHTKSLSVDDRLAILGSANFDRRSLFLNYEANVAIYDAGLAVELRKRQEDYLAHATLLEPDWWARQPALHRRVYEMARLLSPLI